MAANGKWRKYRDTLPAFVNPSPGWMEKVEDAKGKYVGLDTAELARVFKVNKAAKDEHEEAIKALNIEQEALSKLLVDNMETSSMELVKLATGETVFINDEPYASVEDRAKVLAWVRRSKMERLLTIQWQTLNALVKELMVGGKPTPPGVKVFMKTSARVRGGSGEAPDAED